MADMKLLEKIEEHMVSDDFIVRNFCLGIIHTSFIGTEKTFMLGLEANEKNWRELKTNVHLLKLENLPMPEQGLDILLESLSDESMPVDQLHFFIRLINTADPCLLSGKKREIAELRKKINLKAEGLDFYTDLCKDSRETVLKKFAEVLDELDGSKYFNQTAFSLGEKIAGVIAKRGFIAPETVMDKLDAAVEKEFLNFEALLMARLAGEMKLKESIDVLSGIFINHQQDDVFIEEFSRALIKIGTNEAVDAVRPLLDLDSARYHTPDILANIHTEYARKALIEEFERNEDIESKTMLAAALCKQLSEEAIPLVENLINEGYADGILSLEKALYSNCVINGADHPKLNEWKQLITSNEMRIYDGKSTRLTRSYKSNGQPSGVSPAGSPQKKQTNAGRNDPCPCGSGKKYKKCCLGKQEA